MDTRYQVCAQLTSWSQEGIGRMGTEQLVISSHIFLWNIQNLCAPHLLKSRGRVGKEALVIFSFTLECKIRSSHTTHLLKNWERIGRMGREAMVISSHALPCKIQKIVHNSPAKVKKRWLEGWEEKHQLFPVTYFYERYKIRTQLTSWCQEGIRRVEGVAMIISSYTLTQEIQHLCVTHQLKLSED